MGYKTPIVTEQAMKCGTCKAEMEESTVTYTEDVEKMVDQFAASAGSEASVINFAKSVA
jgi:ferredoxin